MLDLIANSCGSRLALTRCRSDAEREGQMKGSLAPIVSALLLSATSAVAQDITVGPGTLELAVVPGGATYFTSTDSNPSAPGFGNYTLGGVLTYNVTRVVGIEGEASGTIGMRRIWRSQGRPRI